MMLSHCWQAQGPSPLQSGLTAFPLLLLPGFLFPCPDLGYQVQVTLAGVL